MAETRNIDEIANKMSALGVWRKILPSHWAIKARGVAFPYFCATMGSPPAGPVKWHFMLLDGWQTFHDYLHVRMDSNFGFYSTPYEMPHYEVAVLKNGEAKVFRHDPGYVARVPNEREAELCSRLLWEAYGVMLRIESEPTLVMKYASENAIFCRTETAHGTWRDEPLALVQPRPHTETISFLKKDVSAAKDLPLAADERLALDLRILPGLHFMVDRPRTVYGLLAIDMKTRKKVINRKMGVNPETGLRGIWEALPSRLIKEFIERGHLPGELMVMSGRVFRMLRTLCADFPFKLSLHDSIPELDAAFRQPD